jgi:hypothetical protein
LEPPSIMSSNEVSMPQGGTEHHGLVGAFQDHWKLLLVGLVIFLIVAAAFGLRNSPFWDLLSSLFGAGAAAATVIEDQLNKCFGSFTDLINPFGGCFIGVFALGSGLIWLAAKIYSIKSSAEKPLVEQAKFETGKSDTDLAKTVLERQKSISDVELIDQLKKSGISDPTKAQLDAARAVIANNGIAQETKQAIDSSSMSPSERKAATENLIESNRVANADVMSEKDIPVEDIRDVEDAAKEFEEPVIDG